jgi:hypothetical protein
MTSGEDYAKTERWFWFLVTFATDILGGDSKKADETRTLWLALPWERRRFFYNSSPLDVAADLAGVVPTEEQSAAYRRLEDRVFQKMDRALSVETQDRPATAHRHRIDVDRVAATG